MAADLKAKLAQVAARIAATQERLRGLERSAASVRQELEHLRREVEHAGEQGAVPDGDEWGARVPTRTRSPAAEDRPEGPTVARITAPGVGKVDPDR